MFEISKEMKKNFLKFPYKLTETNKMDLNNTTENIVDYYTIALESCEKYEQELQQSKNASVRNWQTLNELQDTFLDALNVLIQTEDTDIYFMTLLNLRSQFLQHTENLEKKKQEITINDITIKKLFDNSGPLSGFHANLSNNEVCFIRNEYGEQSQAMLSRQNPNTSISVHPKNKDNNSSIINDTQIRPNSNGLNDIVGLVKEKNSLKEVVIYPILYPHLFTGVRKPWSTALLFGPPGTGKTKLVHSVAAEINATLHSVSCADLFSRFVGVSEKSLRFLFQYCIRSNTPRIIFFDEVDSFCRTRTSTEADHSRRIKNDLLAQISALESVRENKVFFLAATNCPWDLDTAFIRRFHKRIYVPLPDRTTRHEILKKFMNNIEQCMTQKQLFEILDSTAGFSGSDIEHLINTAAFQPLHELENTTQWKMTPDAKYVPLDSRLSKNPRAIQSTLSALPAKSIMVRDVNNQDFYFALENVSKTVSTEDAQKYEEFNKLYGSL